MASRGFLRRGHSQSVATRAKISASLKARHKSVASHPGASRNVVGTGRGTRGGFAMSKTRTRQNPHSLARATVNTKVRFARKRKTPTAPAKRINLGTNVLFKGKAGN